MQSYAQNRAWCTDAVAQFTCLGNEAYFLICWPNDLCRFSQSFFKVSPIAYHFFKQILIGHDNQCACFIGAMEEAILKLSSVRRRFSHFYGEGNGLFGNMSNKTILCSKSVCSSGMKLLYVLSVKPAQILNWSTFENKSSSERSSYGQSKQLNKSVAGQLSSPIKLKCIWGRKKTELKLTRVWGCAIFWPPARPHGMHPGVSSYVMEADSIWNMNAFWWLMWYPSLP